MIKCAIMVAGGEKPRLCKSKVGIAPIRLDEMIVSMCKAHRKMVENNQPVRISSRKS